MKSPGKNLRRLICLFPWQSLPVTANTVWRLLFGREPRLLTHQVVEIYKHSWAYDSSLAQKELGYRITPLKDGLIEMIGWLKNAGLVK